MAKRKYFMVLDTETANGLPTDKGGVDLSCSLVYDIGFVVVDKKGRLYERVSMAIGDVFCGMKDIMRTAYYADKLPKYWEEIKAGTRDLVSFFHARKIVLDTIDRYEIKEVSAHNARFDVNALNNTIRYISKSSVRYFFPKKVTILDTYKGALNTICKQKTYVRFCERNGYMTKHKTPRVKATAEVLYRYITHNVDFVEEHQGVYDTEIEAVILRQILRQHSKKEYLVLYPARV